MISNSNLDILDISYPIYLILYINYLFCIIRSKMAGCEPFYYLSYQISVIFSKGRHLEGLFSFNFETTQCKNNFDTNLVNPFSGY